MKLVSVLRGHRGYRRLAWVAVTTVLVAGISLAQVAQRAPVATEMRQTPEHAADLLSLEDRVARLEAELQKTREREAALQKRLDTHTHSYTYRDVGLLREPLNGRAVELAISPRVKSSQTGPASQ